jgi:hypothetical protein
MGHRRSPLSSARVKEVQRQITHWRKTRRKRSPMAPALWDAAASLARTHGIYAIAQALRVSYESLKRHVEQPPRDGSLSRLETPGFVEVPAAQLVSSSKVAGTVVEIMDVLRLADTFWRRRS